MVKQGFLRANIPFCTAVAPGHSLIDTAGEQGWSRKLVQGDFLLKHINTSFANNVVCFQKACQDLVLTVPVQKAEEEKLYRMSVSEVEVYCFDTGIGICSFHIPCTEGMDEAALANMCSVLHCSVPHKDGQKSTVIYQGEDETYLSCLAEQYLRQLLGDSFALFGMFNETSLRRINMFSVVLCGENKDQADSTACDELCYRLANAFDDRDQKLPSVEQALLRQQKYIRWCFTNRGSSVVANLTGQVQNDKFLQSRWVYSTMTNYLYLYLMVLHEKFAIYSFLNSIAEDPDMSQMQINQKALLDFNSKYIFSVVSDEQNLQTVYLKFKESTNTDDLYAELLDQLRHMFDYAQFQEDKNNETESHKLNLISLVISVVCSVSIIFDTVDLFSSHGCSLGLQSVKNAIFTGVIALEGILFVALLVLVIAKNKKRTK